jgi:hypothetical protein
MNFLCLTIVSTVSTAAFAVENLPPGWTPRIVSYFHSSGGTLKGPDRTITWGAWKKVPGVESEVRTGDRYLGGTKWEHYLGFKQHRTSTKAIKLFMIRLGREGVREEVVIRPGLRYAILRVVNGTMTARKGFWSWTAQEV